MCHCADEISYKLSGMVRANVVVFGHNLNFINPFCKRLQVEQTTYSQIYCTSRSYFSIVFSVIFLAGWATVINIVLTTYKTHLTLDFKLTFLYCSDFEKNSVAFCLIWKIVWCSVPCSSVESSNSYSMLLVVVECDKCTAN